MIQQTNDSNVTYTQQAKDVQSFLSKLVTFLLVYTKKDEKVTEKQGLV